MPVRIRRPQPHYAEATHPDWESRGCRGARGGPPSNVALPASTWGEQFLFEATLHERSIFKDFGKAAPDVMVTVLR
jgi:hypothetical protein